MGSISHIGHSTHQGDSFRGTKTLVSA